MAPAADEGVVGIDNGVEVLPVGVVEARPAIAHPALGDECTQEERLPPLPQLEPVVPAVPIHSREQHPVSGPDLVQPLPEEQRHADHVDEAEDRVVAGPGELVPLARA